MQFYLTILYRPVATHLLLDAGFTTAIRDICFFFTRYTVLTEHNKTELIRDPYFPKLIGESMADEIRHSYRVISWRLSTVSTDSLSFSSRANMFVRPGHSTSRNGLIAPDSFNRRILIPYKPIHSIVCRYIDVDFIW